MVIITAHFNNRLLFTDVTPKNGKFVLKNTWTVNKSFLFFIFIMHHFDPRMDSSVRWTSTINVVTFKRVMCQTFYSI